MREGNNYNIITYNIRGAATARYTRYIPGGGDVTDTTADDGPRAVGYVHC